MKVNLYGSSSIDTITYYDKFPQENQRQISQIVTRAGGIANLYRFLKQYDPEIDITCSTAIGNDHNGRLLIGELKEADLDLEVYAHIPTSTASVLVNLENSTRTLSINRGASELRNKYHSNSGDWTHLCYYDAIPHFELFPNVGHTLSVDLCGAIEYDNKIISDLHNLCLDYLIISGAEFIKFRSPITKLAFKLSTCIIVHFNDHVVWADELGEHGEYWYPEILKRVDTLGAGDYFCAAFILSRLYFPNEDYFRSIQRTHQLVFNFLKEDLVRCSTSLSP